MVVIINVGVDGRDKFFRSVKAVGITKLCFEYLTRSIGKYMVLPEEPATLVAVIEKEQSADQGGFKSAENGD